MTKSTADLAEELLQRNGELMQALSAARVHMELTMDMIKRGRNQAATTMLEYGVECIFDAVVPTIKK